MTEKPRSTTIASVPLTLLSPAKINLHLRVGPLDAAGYHPLRSWMITTTLHDTIRFERTKTRSLVCNEPAIPCDKSNLVWRAADAILQETGASDDMSIELTKRIPAGAGLGGGSSNAAATLVGVNRLFALGHSHEELARIAATLGSDVPFFLGPPGAIATGRGEHLDACPVPRSAKYAVLLLPPFAVSTAAAYRVFDAIDKPEPDRLGPFDAAGWAALPANDLLAQLVNDLEPAAFAIEPRLADLREAAERQLGRTVRMSGSGSTLFSLFDDPEDAASQSRATAAALMIRAIFVELGNPSGFFD
jgi:4-diphosphocytidyl-2-C-methyl-D-erythritol kinase